MSILSSRKMLPTLSYGAAQPSLASHGNRALTRSELADTRGEHQAQIDFWAARPLEAIQSEPGFTPMSAADAEDLRQRMIAHHRKCLAYWMASYGW